MTDCKIISRIELLFTCLQYCNSKTALLTTGERICINQEIGSLLVMLKKSNSEHRKVSDKIEVKLQNINNLIKLSGFVPINPIPFEPFNID